MTRKLMYLLYGNRTFVNRKDLSEEDFIKSVEIELGYHIIKASPPAGAASDMTRWFKIGEPLFPQDAFGYFV